MPVMDNSNTYFRLAASFVNYTHRPIFLTGKAGTGKTTFLKYIRETSPKNLIVTAPTGVAAINAGGVTLHSMFQLPFGPYLPTLKSTWNPRGEEAFYNKHTLLEKTRLNATKIQLLQELELLIIDEVSMVRADMLDAVDLILRHVRKRTQEAFGGVQVLLIGDLYQLPPVVQEHEWQVLQDFYASPFFFDAEVMRNDPPLCISLQKIYRQDEADFIDLLNNIRNNQVREKDLQRLDQHYQPGFRSHENYITLTSHNHKANVINERELQLLPGKLHEFAAETEGDFNENAFPADAALQLKEGAQIMFIKNDKGEYKRYYNGKIGIVERITYDDITIAFPGEQETLLLEKEEWKNIRYSFDDKTGTISEETLGVFRQFPIRLAWAVTIHKSQGLTFEKAIIDAGDSFAPGQVYVALSRLTSMRGLVLHSKIHRGSISCSEEVAAYMRHLHDEDQLKALLSESQQSYISETIKQAFAWNKLSTLFQLHSDAYNPRLIQGKTDATYLARTLLEKVSAQQETAARFLQQLESLQRTAHEDNYQQLSQRIQAASNYFLKTLQEDLLILIVAQLVKKIKRTKKYTRDLQALQFAVERKIQQLKQAVTLGQGLQQGTDSLALLDLLDDQRKNLRKELEEKAEDAQAKTKKPEKGETFRVTLEMFRQGKSIAEIAKEREMVLSTIESHLSRFISSGEVSVYDIVQAAKVEAILEVLKDMETISSAVVKAKLGNDYSYGEIKAVISHFERK